MICEQLSIFADNVSQKLSFELVAEFNSMASSNKSGGGHFGNGGGGGSEIGRLVCLID